MLFSLMSWHDSLFVAYRLHSHWASFHVLGALAAPTRMQIASPELSTAQCVLRGTAATCLLGAILVLWLLLKPMITHPVRVKPRTRKSSRRFVKILGWFSVASLLGAAALSFGLSDTAKAQTGLQVTYGSQGIQTLSYRGQVLEDVGAFPSDGFHIWHMKCADLQGNLNTNGQYGWGENNNGRTWDSGSKTWTYRYVWGTIQVQYQQSGDTLNMVVTETNNSGSGVVFDGASIYPLALHFPTLPAGFANSSYNQFAFNTTAPSVTTANFGSGVVVAATADASKSLYTGFQPAGATNAYTALISSTSPDSLAAFQPHNDRQVQPGQTDSFTVSLRFAPAGTTVATLVQDVYANWAKTWPVQLNWTDRRAIGTVYLASSAGGNSSVAAGFPNNPRRYFNDGNAGAFNVNTQAGLVQFQNRVLQQARDVVTNLGLLKAQGMVTWDIEGEQFPMNTSYVCSPDQIAAVAPEMESIVTSTSSAYKGMKLDDAYFKTVRDAGFKVGVCVRPQHFSLNANGTAQQVTLPAAADVTAELMRKVKYAHDRWGATLFYIDSSVDGAGGPLDASIFQQVAAAFPDSLLMPEEATPKAYAYTAPFMTFLFHGDLGTDASVYNYYPRAFSANLINDVDAGTLQANQAALTASVARGDVLMAHSEFPQANNATIVRMYADAASAAATPAPVTPTPVAPAPTTPAPVTTAPVAPTPAPAAATSPVSIVTPVAGQSVSGALTVTGSVNLTLDAAGSYLMIDGVPVGTRRVTNGPYLYALDTTAVKDGQHTLQLWAHDVGNNTVLSPAITVTVANGAVPVAAAPVAAAPVASTAYPLTLTYPVSGQAISGVVNALATIVQTLDAAGSFLMVDGQPWGTRRVTGAPYVFPFDTSLLPVGVHQLQVWAHDIANQNLLSNPVSVTVQR